jgi:molybdopterin-containing oxidoreductase family membrane subunit
MSRAAERTEDELLAPGQTPTTVTRDISDIPLRDPKRRVWWPVFAAAFGLVMVLLGSLGWLFAKGVGIWGIDMPVASRL